MRTVVLFSGGLDSTVLLRHAQQYGEAVALTVDYGQRNRAELSRAMKITDYLGVEHVKLHADFLRPLMASSSQTNHSIPVPHGHYSDESMSATVIPNRNMLLISMGVALAITRKFDRVSIGTHKETHVLYPDCTPEFVRAMVAAVGLCDRHPVELWTPFLDWLKPRIVKFSADICAPIELSWTCYERAEVPCGLCGACSARAEAFRDAGIVDKSLVQPL